MCAATRRAARRLTQRYEREIGSTGLSASQFELLSLLGATGGQSGRGIAAALELDTTTVSRNVKQLIASGLVAADADAADARQLRYTLTPAGRATHRRALTGWQRAQAAMHRELGAGAPAALALLRSLAASPVSAM